MPAINQNIGAHGTADVGHVALRYTDGRAMGIMANQPEWQTVASANAATVEHAISQLRLVLDEQQYGDFWTTVQDVVRLFKDIKPLTSNDRARLWSDFGPLCERAKDEQARARERRATASRQKRDVVESALNDAYWQARGADSWNDLARANALLAQARSWMNDGWAQVSLADGLVHLSDGRLIKTDRDACWARWHEVKDLIQQRRDDL